MTKSDNSDYSGSSSDFNVDDYQSDGGGLLHNPWKVIKSQKPSKVVQQRQVEAIDTIQVGKKGDKSSETPWSNPESLERVKSPGSSQAFSVAPSPKVTSVNTGTQSEENSVDRNTWLTRLLSMTPFHMTGWLMTTQGTVDDDVLMELVKDKISEEAQLQIKALDVIKPHTPYKFNKERRSAGASSHSKSKMLLWNNMDLLCNNIDL
eukprot:GHVR01131993.1.p1 GENE.GHVR01131993.1~~GHVR01131993.1.p1  ORF type:complete len:206 (+),score=28.54 GHVR01131993.1:121-738(+)